MIDFIDVPFGTRYVGCWEQQAVTSKKEIVDFIKEHLSIDNIGVSCCVYEDGFPFLLVLPFDFDSPNLEDAWKDAIKLYNIFIDKGYCSSLTFSGRKGFHVYLKTVPKYYTHFQIASTQASFKEIYDLKTMDPNIFGDIRRLMRIPGTYNMKGGLCRVLDEVNGKAYDIDKFIERKHNGFSIKDARVDYVPRKYPCVDKLIKDRAYWLKNHPRKTFQPSQKIRFSWVANKLLHGVDPEDIVKEAESFNWDDWNEDRVRYQIEHIASGDYLPLGCNSLEVEGYCVIKYCPYKKLTSEMLKKLGVK
jgi:hypothetical protein